MPLVLLSLIFLLTGCAFTAGEDLYQLPKLPDDYGELQTAVSQVQEDLGAEYSPPTAGDNTQNIQLHDLDQDGEEETAVAFFSVPDDEKPIKIYFFHQTDNGEAYETTWIIEGEAAGIYSIDFVDLSGDGLLDPVVIWQISTDVRAIGAYKLVEEDYDVVELMYSGFTQSAVMDVDQDNQQEILLIQSNESEQIGHAELYEYSDGLMVLTSQTDLSQHLVSVKDAKEGCLTDEQPALFVTSEITIDHNGEAEDDYITDVLAFEEEQLVNLTLDEASGISSSTMRSYTDFQDVYGTDITGNGILDLPIPEELPQMSDESKSSDPVESKPMYLMHWYEFDADGQRQQVKETFHCYDDGWYIAFPETWEGCVTAARGEEDENAVTVRTVTFYYLPNGDENTDGAEPFLSIDRISGTNRNSRAVQDGRFILLEENEVIYSACFYETDTNWNCGISQEELIDSFSMIQADWSAS
ncbi:MAG: hypothetical protein LUC17_01585 [Oscillospiraceae bacterium]|nr:hypothetical protein [Oscillospiraceae bacterium]